MLLYNSLLPSQSLSNANARTDARNTVTRSKYHTSKNYEKKIGKFRSQARKKNKQFLEQVIPSSILQWTVIQNLLKSQNLSPSVRPPVRLSVRHAFSLMAKRGVSEHLMPYFFVSSGLLFNSFAEKISHSFVAYSFFVSSGSILSHIPAIFILEAYFQKR